MRILLADHDYDTQAGLANLLEGMGYEVAPARTREETSKPSSGIVPTC